MNASDKGRTATSARERARLLAGAAVALGLLAAACGGRGGGGDTTPTGQVVARMNGEDITMLEVNAELAGTPIPPDMSRRDAEILALQNIVTRRQLMAVARERQINQSPQFRLQERRTSEQLLVQALASDIANRVPQPTQAEVDQFIRDNPAKFAERRFWILDQIQFLRPENMERLPLMQAKTMSEVERVLIAGSVEFRRQPASLDALGLNPDFVREIARVLRQNPREVFMFANQPQGSPEPVVLINQVTEERVLPFTGERARVYARNFLRQIGVQQALGQEVERQREAAASAVNYQEGFAPANLSRPMDAAALGGAATGAPAAAPGVGALPGQAPAQLPGAPVQGGRQNLAPVPPGPAAPAPVPAPAG